MLSLFSRKNINGKPIWLCKKACWFAITPLFLVFFLLFSQNSFAASNKGSGQSKAPTLPATLKADKIFGDQNNNTIDAIGHVELIKNENTIFSDKMTYDRNNNIIKAFGDVKIINYQTGNVIAEYADIKDDLSSGHFDNAKIIFINGSYLTSPKVTQESKTVTVLDKSIFSVCPNEEIAKDNDLAGKKTDAVTIKSSTTTIVKDQEKVKLNNAIIKFYNVPILYSPYMSVPFPSSKRKSGFLAPSYMNNTRFGLGFVIPYYFNIAPNRDLTTTLRYHPSQNSIILRNEFRHLTRAGKYNIDIEVANNTIKPLATTNTTTTTSSTVNNEDIRWTGKTKGDFKLNANSDVEFDVFHVGDKNYQRDYHNDYRDHTTSTANVDYIKGRNYYSAGLMSIQELDLNQDSTLQPTAAPILNAYKESKPGSYNERYSIAANSTVISRKNGLQYRRVSAKPEVKIPYNLHGNLFEASANVQSDIYNLEDNSNKYTTPSTNYRTAVTNFRPEAALNWSLPVARNFKKSTLVIEPMANFVMSGYQNNFNLIPDQDSNNNELTQNNLFLNDRFFGYDRNEAGKRYSYGMKSSLFNSLGQFSFGLGQSVRKSYRAQDITLRGFNDNNKSNIVGELFYRSKKHFDITYNFHLNESNYNNELNEVISTFNFDRILVSASYLLLKKTIYNPTARNQLTASSTIKLTKSLNLDLASTRDFAAGREIYRKIGITYNGCCIIYGFSITESHPANFTIPQISYNFILSIRSF